VVESKQFAGLRVLVVDDDQSFRRLVVRMLEAAGCEVVQAADMSGVFAVLAEPARLDLLVTDLHLAPGTPHGYSIARVVQTRQPEIKVVFMTGGDPQAFALCKPEDMVLRKPFRAPDLIEAVKQVLAR
jgi:CheY-like chemotaxis protein